MGAALYVVLEKEIPGLDTMINGKTLSKAGERLAEVASQAGVRPLMEFFSMDPGDASGFLEGEGMGDIEIPPEQWFLAEEGLRTVRALLAEVERDPTLKSAREDLAEFERVLDAAQKAGVRWHLAVDI